MSYVEGYKWQPLLAIVNGGRIQCHCGALAVILDIKVFSDNGKLMEINQPSFWCQACYMIATSEEDKCE